MQIHINRFGFCACSTKALGALLLSSGQNKDALEILKIASRMNPSDSSVWSNLGLAFYNLSQYGEADAALTQARLINPDDSMALNNLGLVKKALGQFEQALDLFEQAISMNPNLADAHSNKGCLLSDHREIHSALESLLKAVALQPQRADFLYNLAKIQYQNRRSNYKDVWADRALKTYRMALEINPKLVRVHRDLAGIFRDRGLLIESTNALKTALSMDPTHEATRASLLHNLAQMCCWDEFESFFVPNLGVKGKAISPWLALAWEDNPRAQKERSACWFKDHYSHIKERKVKDLERVQSEKLRVGYFSSDFQPNHATMHLIGDLFKYADFGRFDVHLFSYGSAEYETLRSTFPDTQIHIHVVSDWSFKGIIELADECQLDIAVDLKGYTENARIEPFVARVAPIQISFLGYPGTCGASFMDYIIADSITLPIELLEESVTEKPIYLPCYQPNSNIDHWLDVSRNRDEYGLPTEAFILCAFNASYKITKMTFDCWLQILRSSPKSVLWLLETNQYVRSNLLKEAERQGIDGDRLIFAEPVDRSHHLKRMAQADLFLDTFFVNGHTTVSDALRAGLPVVTKPGRQFAARVAASLLTNVGLPELICQNDSDYIGKVIDLINHPGKMKRVREKLNRGRSLSGLFDPKQFSASLENAYLKVQGVS